MHRSLYFKLMLIMALFFTIIISCKKGENALTADGVVINTGAVALDGCGWQIKIGDSTRYSPINLSDDYKKDNLDIVLNYQILKSKFTCGWGTTVTEIKILRIRKR